ncbi:hypothetical protein T4B_10360 [Trichinella pseudospiralis]|uniref:Uncharacterized protein n=2 Tax=Trichinella pseudospiralis TaxID=6337 RepID=A0A0V1FC93_TRIPS|nr:hypothetical protein T4A_9368 [Trichinella pseudospiralis]KRY83643.1 hypothetical protein T4D_16248 [Trichinella pseudospiralis]KRZ25532.1 hypothetical protein T4B_10360 [Trichinella pseudospiralis]KRZ40617.1 hypothetical protein T4C_12672 [Trichinella pseudospiralis]
MLRELQPHPALSTTCTWRDVYLCVSFVCESETQCPLAAAVACTNGVCRCFLQMLKHKFTRLRRQCANMEQLTPNKLSASLLFNSSLNVQVLFCGSLCHRTMCVILVTIEQVCLSEFNLK